MTKKTKIALEMSQGREKLNTLLALDEMTPDQRSEMTKLSTRQQECEVELRAVSVGRTRTQTDRGRLR